MQIVPIGYLPKIIDPARHDDREPSRRRQPPPRKREEIPPVPVYTPGGEIQEEQPAKIDVLV